MRVKQCVHLCEVATVPDPQAVADAEHFAEAVARAQRHGVEVIDHQLVAHHGGVLAVEVGAHRCRCHLPQLLLGRFGAAFGRVPVFLDLRGERAAAGRFVLRVGHVQHAVPHGAGEAAPFDRGVAPGLLRIEQHAVLDEQQRVDQRGRDRVEAGVDPLRMAPEVDQAIGCIEHLQAGLGLLVIRRVEAQVDGRIHRARGHGLLGHRVAARAQTFEIGRYLAVAEAPVVGPRVGVVHGRARAGPQGEGQLLAELRQVGRL